MPCLKPEISFFQRPQSWKMLPGVPGILCQLLGENMFGSLFPRTKQANPRRMQVIFTTQNMDLFNVMFFFVPWDSSPLSGLTPFGRIHMFGSHFSIRIMAIAMHISKQTTSQHAQETYIALLCLNSTLICIFWWRSSPRKLTWNLKMRVSKRNLIF